MKLDELVLEGKEGRGVARGDSKFAIDGAQVGIDRARADDQGFGDLHIGQSLCDQPQHLHFTFGQLAQSRGWGRNLLSIRPGTRGWVTGGYGVLACG